MRTAERLFDAYLLVVAFLLVELCAVGWIHRAELLDANEFLLALRTLGPIAAIAALPFGLVLGAWTAALERAHRTIARASFSAGATLFAAIVAYGVATGRHLAGARRPVFMVVVAGLASALAWALAAPTARWLRGATTRERAKVVAGISLAATLLVELANARVLPRLYPAFHHGLSFVAAFSAVCLALAWSGSATTVTARRLATTRAVLALVVFAFAAASTASAAKRLAPADNVRMIFAEHAPTLGRAVELAAWLEPPPPLEVQETNDSPSGPSELDLAGIDVLLVTIDALRADHLGAYGYARATSPNLDALAREGLVFERAYTPTPHTSYAISSLLTGKYMRPLLAMDLGGDSETIADHLRRYGYKTAAFYPPAVFFIDEARFAPFEARGLGFEYRRREFLPAKERAAQLAAYLDGDGREGRVFAWVHLFEPHEPYEAHEGRDFGPRDLDRYDAEIAEADAALGSLVDTMRSRRPGALVIVTADHGEEFGEHGGRYHGTTVYEEQVRVPLVVSAPGRVRTGRIAEPVQLVDLLPTTLAGLGMPRPAQVRGRDLGTLWARGEGTGEGHAFSETERLAMLARGAQRLVCDRRASACALYDLATDPGQTRSLASAQPDDLARLKAQLRTLDASHGRYERGEEQGAALPEILRRGLAGDGDAAPELAALLDDADATIRRKSAEVLFDLRRKEVVPALRLALGREDDPQARALVAVALARLGEGVPLVFELVEGDDTRLRRLAALALAEQGDRRGEAELVAWWRAGFPDEKRPRAEDVLDFERARELLEAIAVPGHDAAVQPLIGALDDVRLRPFVASALAKIGNGAARTPLAARLLDERFVPNRKVLAEALQSLGARYELSAPLVSLLGMPEPLDGALGYALRAGILTHVGGPARATELDRLRRFASSGVTVDVAIPAPIEGAPTLPGAPAVRAVCRAQSPGGGTVIVGLRGDVPLGPEKKGPVPAVLPTLDGARAARLTVPASTEPVEVFASLPDSLGLRPGERATVVVYATQGTTVEACALVPTRAEVPPPAPKPWSPGDERAD
jgi:arylsulfatase A-like enzyme